MAIKEKSGNDNKNAWLQSLNYDIINLKYDMTIK